MNKNYNALFLLHSLGDIIGYNNNEWDLNNTSNVYFEIVNEYIYKFIAMGGINGLDISKKYSSKCSFFHLCFANTILKYENKINNKFINILKNNLISTNNKLISFEEKKIKNKYKNIIARQYSSHNQISISIHKFTDTKDISYLKYDENTNDNSCAVHSLCLGLCFYGVKNRDLLIINSIKMNKVTHNSPIGFLGGLTTALFVSFAIEGINIHKWPFELIKILKSDTVKKFIDKDNLEEYSDYLSYIHFWNKYIKIRFKNNKVIFLKSFSNPILRLQSYYSLFEAFEKPKPHNGLGNNGYSSVIIAYDALLDCSKNWEKLITYSSLYPSFGNFKGPNGNIATGAIAGGLYGILYGFGDVPVNLLDNIENKKELINISNKIFNKFYKT